MEVVYQRFVVHPWTRQKVLAVIGALLGLLVGFFVFAAANDAEALLYCGAIGLLGGWVAALRSRVEKLEIDRADQWRPTRTAKSESWPAAAEPRPSAEGTAAAAPPPSAASPSPKPQLTEPSETEPAETILQRALGAAKSWLTTGNVPVKVGVVVSLFGLGFFIKYAIDEQLFVFPLWARLALVAAFGLALFGIGWQLRRDRPVYALSLQGGGMAVLYLTIYAAAEFYAILPGTAALALMVVVTAATGLAAVLQDSRTMIAFGIAGGFAAPLLVASEAGDHIALFSYYAVLNAAILSVAWFKAWRMLNLLGFLFTFSIAGLWGYFDYRPEHFATTEPFLVLFVLMYIGIAVLFARRQPPQLRGFVDATIVFGTPVAGFALQSRLVESAENLAWSAAALAVLYAALGAWKWQTAELRALAWAFFGLALMFLTVAFPLALDAQWTAAAWAAQGALLAWFGMRSGALLLAAAGAALQLLAAGSYLTQPGLGGNVDMAVLNGQFLGAALIAAAGWIVGASYDRSPHSEEVRTLIARVALGWGGMWWLLAGIREIGRALEESLVGTLAFFALSAFGAAFGARWVRWPRLEALALVLLPAMAVLLVGSVLGSPHPFADFGWLAWPLAFAVQYAVLRCRESRFPALGPAMHVGTYWLLAALIASEAWWLGSHVRGGDWAPAAAGVAAAVAALTPRLIRAQLPWPLEQHWRTYAHWAIPALMATVPAVLLIVNLTAPGSSAPLPYLPILNPLTVAFVVAMAVAWIGAEPVPLRDRTRLAQFAATLGVLLLLSAEVARGAHHFAGVAYEVRALAGSATFQAGLSLVWGLAGLAGMVAGAALARREVWIGGAVVMGMVIVKLFLVELGNTGTLARVVSFLGVGVLLLIVGYFAPVPKAQAPAN